jgi:hypothetical protein
LRRLRERRLRYDADAAEIDDLSPEELTRRLPQFDRAEMLLAHHLERKNAFALSAALTELTGRHLAIWIFGIGVLGMVFSTVSLQMLGCGFVVCEALGIPPKGWAQRLAVLPAVLGVLGPFLWQGDAQIWLALPTSMMNFTLLPLAYITFWMAMNSRGLMGDQMPRGGRRVAWNVGMGIAVSITTAAAVYMIFTRAESFCFERWGWRYGGELSLAVVAALALVVAGFHLAYRRRRRSWDAADR